MTDGLLFLKRKVNLHTDMHTGKMMWSHGEQTAAYQPGERPGGTHPLRGPQKEASLPISGLKQTTQRLC